MNILKKFVIVSALFFSVASVAPAMCTTQDDIAAQLTASGKQVGTEVKDPRTIAMSLIRVAFGLIGTIFLCLTLYAGFLWMTAGGNDEKVTKATSLLQQAAIGLIIILLSYSITWFVFNSIFYAGEPGRYQYSGMFNL